MNIVHLDQRTQAWLEWRKNGVTASEAAVILGLSPYKTLWRLWAEKCGIAKPEDLSRNPYVRHGIEYEDVARREFERRHPGELALPLCGESKKHPVMRASFDGIISARRPVEIKCPCRSVFEKVKRERENSEGYKLYLPQVQHQMCVSGATEGYLFFWHHDEEPVEFLIKRDDALIDELIMKSNEFAKMVKTRKAPEKDPQRDVWVPKGRKAELWASAAEVVKESVAEMQKLSERLKELETAKKKAETELISLMGSYYNAEYDGVRITRFHRSGAVDYSALLRDHAPHIGEELLDSYRKEGTEQHRITVSDSSLPDWLVDAQFEREIEKIKQARNEDLFF